MVDLTINGKKYKFPERITLEKWKQLAVQDFNDVDQWSNILATALDEDIEIIKKCSLKSLTLAMSFCIQLLNARQKTKIIDLNSLTLGEFIDLDCYVTISVEKHIEDIVKMLKVEETVMADEALWLLEQYMLFRTHTFRAYSGLFGLNEPKEEEDDDEDKVRNPNQVIKNWYAIIMDLAEGSLLKIDEVTDQPYKKAFNFMAWKKERVEAENLKQMQQQQSRQAMSRR